MRICNTCGRQYKESSRHNNCPACRGKAVKDKICPNCGIIIQRKSAYCNTCNNILFPSFQKPEIIAIKYTLKKARNKSRGRVIETSVSPEYLLTLLEEQKYKCAYTGLPLSLPGHRGCIDKRLCASLDRINSSLGYVEGNVQ